MPDGSSMDHQGQRTSQGQRQGSGQRVLRPENEQTAVGVRLPSAGLCGPPKLGRVVAGWQEQGHGLWQGPQGKGQGRAGPAGSAPRGPARPKPQPISRSPQRRAQAQQEPRPQQQHWQNQKPLAQPHQQEKGEGEGKGRAVCQDEGATGRGQRGPPNSALPCVLPRGNLRFFQEVPQLQSSVCQPQRRHDCRSEPRTAYSHAVSCRRSSSAGASAFLQGPGWPTGTVFRRSDEEGSPSASAASTPAYTASTTSPSTHQLGGRGRREGCTGSEATLRAAHRTRSSSGTESSVQHNTCNRGHVHRSPCCLRRSDREDLRGVSRPWNRTNSGW